MGWLGGARERKIGGMENEGCRRWIERLGLYALGGVEARGTDDVSAGPISLAVPLIGGLIVAVTLYMLGAVVLVQGGGLAAITLGIFVGTYSSIYMSAPILIWCGVTRDSFVPTESRADLQDRRARGEA